MKKTYVLLIITIILSQITIAQNKNFIDYPYIEVEGYADTLVTPNLIYLKIILSEKDTKDKISLEEQERKMIQVFKNIGINIETDLTTSDMLSNYRSYLLKQKDILKTKEYVLKVTSAPVASKVFVELENIGISNTSIDRVDHSDIHKLENICRSNAIINSKERAIALTKPISQSIGNAIHITENNNNPTYSLQETRLRIRGVNTFEKTEDAPNIDFEKIKISSTVFVKYALK